MSPDQRRMLAQKWAGVDISPMPMDVAVDAVRDAWALQELEADILANRIAAVLGRAMGGSSGGRRRRRR